MSRELVVASGNRDKAAEVANLLADTSWNIRTLADYPPVEEPVEDGETFEENALLKARYYAAALGVPCVADDSGLEVDVLNGAPGVFSARYAGEGCSYADNNAKLFRELAAYDGEEARQARFRCCAAYVDPEGTEFIAEGAVEGHIAPEPRGTNGFGYDPVFIPEGFDATFGELAPETKHAISHRGRAFGQLRDLLAGLE
ncbi:MAG: RdgB/HAM1 family non-canonical purine NTP pyrophosphatase [Candidatus Hydrogenedentota bacterium]